jgi:hypothetical protein
MGPIGPTAPRLIWQLAAIAKMTGCRLDRSFSDVFEGCLDFYLR